MTRQEIIDIVKTNFEYYGETNLVSQRLKTIVDVWERSFKDYPKDLIENCFYKAIAKSKFPIQVAHIFDEINEIADKMIPTPTQEYENLVKAIEKRKEIEKWRSSYFTRGQKEENASIEAKDKVINLYNSLSRNIRLCITRETFFSMSNFSKISPEQEKQLKFELNKAYNENYKANKEIVLNSLKIGGENALCITQEK